LDGNAQVTTKTTEAALLQQTSAPVMASLGAQACAGPALNGLPDAALLWKQEGLLVKLWFSVSVVRTRHPPDQARQC